jgi:hypothetical protein
MVPSRPPPLCPFELESFTRLITLQGKKRKCRELPKFVKNLEEITEVALPLEKTIQIALSLAERALIGQFTGLWPSPKSMERWVHREMEASNLSVCRLLLGRERVIFI